MELKWAIARLGVEEFWDVKESPLEMTYRPTGQKIYFRGMDDSIKITSIAVEVGYLNFLWIEEAYEISREADFDMIDESIRGQCPPPLFKQVTLTFNPWNERHWLKKRFFDAERGDVLAKTTNYTCNEFLDESDRALFENMRQSNPRRYNVAGLGNWGISEGVVYDNWKEAVFDHTADEFRKAHPKIKSAFGLDFGYTNDPSAMFCGLIDEDAAEIYVFDEMYEKGLTNKAIYNRVAALGYAKEKIIADCGEPKSIDELKQLGMRRTEASKKGSDSVRAGIQFIQDYKLIIHERCVNFLTEISNYSWKVDSKTGEKLNEPIGDFNHLMDAMRYALEPFTIRRVDYKKII